MLVLQRVPYAISALSVVACMSILSYTFYQIIQPRALRIQCDQFFSQLQQEKIASLVTSKPVRTVRAQSLHKDLSQEVSGIASITISYKSNQIALVTINSAEPLLVFQDLDKNNCLIITNNGLISPDVFNACIIATKNTLFGYKISELSQEKIAELITSAHLLKEHFFLAYKITWYSAEKIVLQDLACPQLYIITDISTIIDNKRLNYASKIYHAYYKQKPMKIDIRFDQFMSCAPYRGII